MTAKITLQSVLQLVAWTVITGIAYPLVMTGLLQLLFPKQAKGSLVYRDGKVVGSAFIAQQFQGDIYFWPRPSAGAYATVPSAASNLGPTSAHLRTSVAANLVALRSAHHLAGDAPVPSDLVLTSASGVDPDISPEAAYFQIERVAKARGLDPKSVSALVASRVQPPQWGFLGEPRVNVLLLNLALDGKATPGSP